MDLLSQVIVQAKGSEVWAPVLRVLNGVRHGVGVQTRGQYYGQDLLWIIIPVRTGIGYP